MLEEQLRKCRSAQKALFRLTPEVRNECLKRIVYTLKSNIPQILKENEKDILQARKRQLSEAFIERLSLTEERILSMAEGVNHIISLDSPVGSIAEELRRPNGLIIQKELVPFGVIAVIFESRPNVCVDIAALCLKTANACVLKGGRDALYTNKALTGLMRQAIAEITDSNCITLIADTNREITDWLLTQREYIDLLIPRGGKGLIQYVVSHAKIPYIETGAGNCHLYIHDKADLDMAIRIAINAKYQRPSVCNSIETILVDEKIAAAFLARLYPEFSRRKIEIRGCEKTAGWIPCKRAVEEDYDTEYNDYIVAVKVVEDIDEAIEHINRHSSKHSETIVTESHTASRKFLNEIDSACVYHNASTRFTDGGEFGFGAELGISTQKLHARGLMGLREICCYKYKIYGEGQVR